MFLIGDLSLCAGKGENRRNYDIFPWRIFCDSAPDTAIHNADNEHCTKGLEPLELHLEMEEFHGHRLKHKYLF